MPASSANLDVLMGGLLLKLYLVVLGALRVIAREAHGAVALDHRDAAAPLRMRHAHCMLERAPFAREIGDRDAARAALVHAPDAILRFCHGQQRRVHQPPLTRSSFGPMFVLSSPAKHCTDHANGALQ